MKQALVALAIFGAMGVAISHADADAAGDDMPRWSQVPCPTEDSRNCFWDAGERGNHKGHSFFAIPVGRTTCLVYWDDAYSKHHNYCI
jgi:hypothetical protein